MIRKDKILFYLILGFLVFNSCKKELLEQNTNSTFSTYDAYKPVDHKMNENGLFFMDQIKDIDSNEYATVFGFNTEGKLNFKTTRLISDFIDEPDTYFDIRINELFVGEKVFAIGDAKQNTSTYMIICEIDQINGQILSKKTVLVTPDPPSSQYFTDLVKTSYGYKLFHFGEYGIVNILKMTKTDNDFNIIDEEELFMGTAFASQEIIYNDAIITPNDELIVCYWGPLASKPSFIVHCINPDYTSKWIQTYTADFSDTDPDYNRDRELMWFNDEILLFSYGFFSGTVDGALTTTTTPCIYNINPNTGLTDSYHLVPGNFLNTDGQDVTFDTDNLLTARAFNNQEIIISGYVTNQNIYSGAMVHLDADFTVKNKFYLGDTRPISRFHYVGINNEGDYIGCGYTPRFSNGTFINPDMSIDALSVFVGNYSSEGKLNFE